MPEASQVYKNRNIGINLRTRWVLETKIKQIKQRNKTVVPNYRTTENESI